MPVNWVMIVPMVILTLGILAFGIWPGWANLLNYNAAASFLYPFGL